MSLVQDVGSFPLYAVEPLEGRTLLSGLPPSVPGGLKVTSTSGTTVSIKWSASKDSDGTVTGYRVYRNGVKIKSVPGASFSDTGLTPSTQYIYTVRAADNEGLFSKASKKLTAKTSSVSASARNAFSTISAISYDGSSGISVGSNEIKSLDNGNRAVYRRVNFGTGAKSVQFDLALDSDKRGGAIELRLDSTSGTLIGRYDVQPTGSSSTFLKQKVNITTTTGTHDLFVIFLGRSDVAHLRSITFSKKHLTQVMPLGDSITQAFTETPSYRWYLWQLLQKAKYDVDFVGSESQPVGGDPPKFDFDQNHEGHTGVRADELEANMLTWAQQFRPDVVLLMAGANDVEQEEDSESIIDDLRNIIDTVRSVVPKVTILLAKLGPDSGHDAGINDLNLHIPELASEKNTSQSRVITVDMNTGFSVSDTLDGVHLTSSGESKMAQRWFNALKPLL